MAVTVPTPPVPPTPPAVPTVTLGGGGSVTESTAPQSGHQSDADRQEAQARQAVARGDGALSKTTKEQPQQPAQQKQPANGTDESKTTVQTDPQAAAAMQADGDQKQQQQSSGAPAPQPVSAHGAVYWGTTLIAIFILAYVLFRTMMKRKKGGAKLSFQDIQAEEDDFRYDAQNLRGLTPDEVLQQLAEEEADEIREARAAAKARLREAGKLPQLPEPPKAAVPKQAARQYRDQLTTILPAESPKAVDKPMPRKDEEGHFEVRV